MSDSRSTKSALLETEQQFHILVDSVEEYAIYLLDPIGNIATWNSGAEKIKQYTADEIIGKNFACFYTPEEIHLTGSPSGDKTVEQKRRESPPAAY
jgi:PAS domain S-box-containing protein